MWSKLTGDEVQIKKDKEVRSMLYNVARGKCNKTTKDKVKTVLKSKEGLKQLAALGGRTVAQHPIKTVLSAASLYALGKAGKYLSG